MSRSRFPDRHALAGAAPAQTPAQPVTVESLAYGGDAVARIGGKVAFIPYAAPGDLVRLGRVEQRKSFLRAEIGQLERPGPARRLAECALFGACGGCQWQHVDYGAQVSSKRAILERALGRLPLQSLEFVSTAPQLHYRRRLRGHWRVDGGDVELGFYRAGSRQVVDVDRCLLAAPSLELAWAGLRARLGAAVTGSGTVAVLSGHSGRVHVSLRLDRGKVLGLGGLLRDPIVGALARGPAGRETRKGATDIELDPRGLRASADTFAQASAAGDSALRETLVALMPRGCRTVLELHAGVGNLTCALADGSRSVLAVESHGRSVELMRSNVRHCPGSVEIRRHDAVEAVRALAAERRRFDLAVLDPPREGARSLVDPLLELAPRHLIYVSCDPMTLARDLERLSAAGYGAAVAVGIDMMPQSYHFESVVRLTRADAAGPG